MQCRYCGRPDKGDAGDYYHRKECEQKDVLRRISLTTDPKELVKLRKELEQARYVGD